MKLLSARSESRRRPQASNHCSTHSQYWFIKPLLTPGFTDFVFAARCLGIIALVQDAFDLPQQSHPSAGCIFKCDSPSQVTSVPSAAKVCPCTPVPGRLLNRTSHPLLLSGTLTPTQCTATSPSTCTVPAAQGDMVRASSPLGGLPWLS